MLLYARYSTDDQNPRSTDAQFANVQRKLPSEYAGCEIHREKDEGISGEQLSRPGIDRVRELVKTRQFTVLIAEDVGRFFRDRAEPLRLGGLCVDHGCRLIALSDRVDTADDRWLEEMARAAERHASCNEDTAKRIYRANEDRWANGFAMGPLSPCYIRDVVDHIAHARTHRGPYRDRKEEKWTHVLVEVYERTARGERPFPPVAAPKDDSELGQAVKFLRLALADGPVKARSIQAQGEENLFSERTIRRAKDFLDLDSRFSHEWNAWFWFLKGDTRRIPSQFDMMQKEMATSFPQDALISETTRTPRLTKKRAPR